MNKLFKILSIILVLTACSPAEEDNAKLETLTISTARGPVVYQIETAETPENKAIGLMNRKSLDENSGMIFDVNPPARISMWMKNTYIPLDMIFIDSKGSITEIVSNTTPMSESIITPDGIVRAVLEINGGQAAQKNIKVGDKVLFRYFRIK